MGFESFHSVRTPEDIQKSHEQAKNFDAQWAAPKDVEIRGEHFNLYDVSPEKPKTEIPVAIMPGWTHTPEVWKKNAQVLVENGRRVLSLDAPHGVPSQSASVEAKRVAGLLGEIESQKIERVDAIGQSLGAIDVLLAASAFPEKFRTIILVSPAGLIGDDTFLNMLGRFSIEKKNALLNSVREGTFDAFNKAHSEGGKSVLHDPKSSAGEALAAARSNVSYLLRGLREKGINIFLIHGADDAAFPFLRVSAELHKQKKEDDRLGDLSGGEEGDILKIVNGVYSVKGGHEDFMYKPEQYTRLAEAALRAVDEKEKKVRDSTV
jgi:pimeloyl-ACP methyl ester carboxylesterase